MDSSRTSKQSEGGQKQVNSHDHAMAKRTIRRGRPPKKEKSMVKVSLYITEDQDHFLEQLKRETGLDKSEHHRRAMELYEKHLLSQRETTFRRRKTDK